MINLIIISILYFLCFCIFALYFPFFFPFKNCPTAFRTRCSMLCATTHLYIVLWICIDIIDVYPCFYSFICWVSCFASFVHLPWQGQQEQQQQEMFSFCCFTLRLVQIFSNFSKMCGHTLTRRGTLTHSRTVRVCMRVCVVCAASTKITATADGQTNFHTHC